MSITPENEKYQEQTVAAYAAYSASPEPPAVRAQQQMTVVPRQAVLYVIASVFFPGLGTGLNGKWGKGALFFFSQIIAIPLILVFGLGILLLFGIRIWACIDAYNETNAWNQAHGLIT